MERNIERGKNDEKTEKFISINWPKALKVAGTAGALVAAVWLTARYLRERKKQPEYVELALKGAENEVRSSTKEIAFLEIGPYLDEITPETRKAISELVAHVDDEEAREALELLKTVIEIDRK